MKLKVGERLILLGILPKEGDFTTLKIVHTLRGDLSFTEEEHKALQFKQEAGTVRWNPKGDTEREINFGEKATELIVDALKKLNSDKKLTDQHYSLYEKFVGD